jgi:hypothetical protein
MLLHICLVVSFERQSRTHLRKFDADCEDGNSNDNTSHFEGDFIGDLGVAIRPGQRIEETRYIGAHNDPNHRSDWCFSDVCPLFDNCGKLITLN